MLLAIAGFSAGLLLGIFALGVFVPRADQSSALWGLLLGLAALLAVKFGLPRTIPPGLSPGLGFLSLVRSPPSWVAAY